MTDQLIEQPKFRSPMRALITGGAGFIGSHLAEVLLGKGYQVTVIDDLSTGRFENIAPLTAHPNFRFAIDTITNEVVMDRLVSECDIIFHMAAAVGVMLIVERPVQTIQTNIMGTEVVYKTALRYRTKVMVASTSEVYGKGNQIPFSEDDDVVLGATSKNRWGYAASKMVDEFLGLAYYQEKGLPVVIFRLFNTVGPRQTGRYGMVVPRFVEQALRGQPVSIYGDGLQTRCFLHVDDAVRAIIQLSETRGALGNVFNVGSTEEISISDLAYKVLELSGSKSEGNVSDRVIFIPYSEAYSEGFEDMRRRVPSIQKIHELTQWQPKHSLQKILEDVIGEKQRALGNINA